VFSDSEPKEEEVEVGEDSRDEGEPSVGGPQPPPPRGEPFAPTRGVLASLRGMPKYFTIQIKGIV